MTNGLGPTLEEYLLTLKSSNHSSVTSLGDVAAAIDELKSRQNVSYRTFERILNFQRDSELGDRLHDLCLIPACIDLMREYRRQNDTLITHAYGFLSLRLICLVLEAALHQTIPRVVPKYDTPYSVDTRAKTVAYSIGTSYETRRPFLVWKSLGASGPEIFTKAGGLSIVDTRFLLDTLFEERKTLLEAWLKNGIPGLSALMVIFWQLAVSHGNNDIWDRAHVMQNRNYIASPKEDRPMTRTLSKMFLIRSKPPQGMITCIDQEDADNLIEAFRRNVEFVDSEDSTPLMTWMTFSAGNPHNVPALISLTRDTVTSLVMRHKYETRGWDDILELNATMIGMISGFFQNLAHKGLNSAPVEETIVTSDICGLGGQFLLFGIEWILAKRTGKSFDRADPDEYTPMVRQMLLGSEKITEIASTVKPLAIALSPPTGVLQPAHEDWSRIMIQINNLAAIYNVEPYTYKPYAEPWVKLGKTLGFELDSTSPCSYSRCFDGRPIPYVRLMKCGSGCGAIYCSHRCQSADWSVESPLSHEAICCKKDPKDDIKL